MPVIDISGFGLSYRELGNRDKPTIVLESLILIATTSRPDPPQIKEQTWQLWEMFRAGHREDIVEGALQFFFAANTFERRPQLVASYRKTLTDYNQVQGESMFEVARAVFDRTDISEQIGAITAPTLAIAGKEDPLAPPAELELIASRLPNARLTIVDEASHLLVVEKPEEVAGIIGEFLRGKAAAGGVEGNRGSGRILVFDGPADSFFGLRYGQPLDDQSAHRR